MVIDIFCIAESWLLPNVPDSFVHILGFRIVRTDTVGIVPKHGVCIYIKDGILTESIATNCPNVHIIKLTMLNTFIAIVYRPPSNNNIENALLAQFLTDFCIGKEVVILGDFKV
jgi:hypothetical protein